MDKAALGMLILLVFGPILCTCNVRHFDALRMKETDLIFSTFLLWETHCTSVLCCSVLCGNDPPCVFFTVSKKASSRVRCRGHSKILNSTDGQQSEESSLYALGPRVSEDGGSASSGAFTSLVKSTSVPQNSLLNETCQDGSKCPANATCLGNPPLCACAPGMFYSRMNDICQQDCPEANLTEEFLIYEGWKLACNRIKTISDITQNECLRKCIEFTPKTCRSATYNNRDVKCLLNDEPGSSFVCNEFRERDVFTYGQRICL